MSVIKLSDQIEDSFNLAEIKSLCFDLGIEYENLSGDTRREKVQELIKYCQRTGLYSGLVELCKNQRPNAEWTFENNSESKLLKYNGRLIGNWALEKQDKKWTISQNWTIISMKSRWERLSFFEDGICKISGRGYIRLVFLPIFSKSSVTFQYDLPNTNQMRLHEGDIHDSMIFKIKLSEESLEIKNDDLEIFSIYKRVNE